MIIKPVSEILTKAQVYTTLAAGLIATVLLFSISPAMAAQPWPDGLREAVHSYFQTLQVTEYRTRDSTLEEPLGVQPMTEFDRAGHKCHEVPGQVYRIFKIPSYFSEEEGSYNVRSKFQLFYRQADEIAEIFSEPWGQGSDGVIRVRFEKVEGKWEAVEKREVLE